MQKIVDCARHAADTTLDFNALRNKMRLQLVRNTVFLEKKLVTIFSLEFFLSAKFKNASGQFFKKFLTCLLFVCHADLLYTLSN